MLSTCRARDPPRRIATEPNVDEEEPEHTFADLEKDKPELESASREPLEQHSGWGKQIRDEWTKLGVKSVKQWCEKVEDREWLASRIGGKTKGLGNKPRG